MKRSDLEHILRASKGVTGESEFIVIGSQSILGPHPDAPRVLRESMEADLYPRLRPELSDVIEGSLGRYSQFNQTFGYYADGVSPETATLPPGWEIRLVKLTNENTGGAIGWCLEPHDLAFSKLAARREKDLAFVAALLRHRLVRPSRVQDLIQAVTDAALRQRLSDDGSRVAFLDQMEDWGLRVWEPGRQRYLPELREQNLLLMPPFESVRMGGGRLCDAKLGFGSAAADGLAVGRAEPESGRTPLRRAGK